MYECTVYHVVKTVFGLVEVMILYLVEAHLILGLASPPPCRDRDWPSRSQDDPGVELHTVPSDYVSVLPLGAESSYPTKSPCPVFGVHYRAGGLGCFPQYLAGAGAGVLAVMDSELASNEDVVDAGREAVWIQVGRFFLHRRRVEDDEVCVGASLDTPLL